MKNKNTKRVKHVTVFVHCLLFVLIFVRCGELLGRQITWLAPGILIRRDTVKHLMFQALLLRSVRFFNESQSREFKIDEDHSWVSVYFVHVAISSDLDCPVIQLNGNRSRNSLNLGYATRCKFMNSFTICFNSDSTPPCNFNPNRFAAEGGW